MKALSIRQPWAWLIAEGIKDVENRTWRTNFRGRFLIHAGLSFDHNALTRHPQAREIKEILYDYNLLPEDLPRGGIVGEAHIYDCLEMTNSEWAEGPWCFLINKAKPLKFMPCKGALSFFNTPGPLYLP